MQIAIEDYYESARHHLEGSEDDVRRQIFDLYPFLLSKFGPQCSIKILIDALNKNQGTTAVIKNQLSKAEFYQGDVSDGQGLHIIHHPQELPNGQLNTIDSSIVACKAAAEFLAGKECTTKELRQALLQTDGDVELAALIAHGLPVEALGDLRAILAATNLKKSEEDPDAPKAVKFKTVVGTNQSSEAFAKIVRDASEVGEIEPAKLGPGKHTGGVLKARDAVTHQSYILKPGSGKQNPIIGESETGATQSQREAAFYSFACALDLGQFVPECHLILCGEKEYACIKFLPFNYKNLNDLKQQDPNLPKRLFSLYNDGTLHKWAVLDYISGNPDRHYGNVMASGDSIRLIDHGSAFAGLDFDPAKDGMSFVPCYLRPGVPGFNKLSVDEKLRKMPRLSAENEKKFRHWLLSLSSQTLGQILGGYGIDPSPELIRLEKLQAATNYQTADLAVLSAWVVP